MCCSLAGKKGEKKKVKSRDIVETSPFLFLFSTPPRSTQISQPTNLVSQWTIKEEKNKCNKQLRKKREKMPVELG